MCTLHRTALFLLFVVLVGATSPAQGQLSSTVINRPCETCQPRAVETADFTNDGVPDLVVSDNAQTELHFYEGTGSGSGPNLIGPKTILSGVESAEDLASGDLDGDGNQDLVVATGSELLVFDGNGDGTFASSVSVGGATTENLVVVADFDGVNGPDIGVADTFNDELILHFNDGSGSFSSSTTLTTAADITSLDAADIENDGDADLVATSTSDNTIQFFQNNGASFSKSQVDGLSSTKIAAFTTVDGNSQIDLVAYANTSSGTPTLVWYSGNGDGTFGSAQTITTDRLVLFSLLPLDANDDGNTDLAAVGRSGRLYAGNGDGTFSSSSLTGFEIGFAGKLLRRGDATVTDINNDGNTDVVGVAAKSDVVGLRRGDGTGSFANENLVPPPDLQVDPQGAQTLAAGDVTGNGHADIVVADVSSPRELVWYENDGSGTFSGKQIVDERFVEEVQVTDVDDDGAAEIVAGDLNDGLEFYEPDGSGGFTSSTLLSDGVSTFAVADLNNDGRSDLVGNFGQFETGVKAAINNGDGSYSQITITTSVGSVSDVAVADLNRDGAPDVLFADNNDQKIVAHPGNGDGTFGSEAVLNSSDFGRQLAIGDFDGDNNLDAAAKVVRNTSTPSTDDNVGVFLNDGTLSPPRDNTYAPTAVPIATTDITGSGRSDLIQGPDWREASTSGGFGTRNTYAPNRVDVVALAHGRIGPNYTTDLVTASAGDDAIAWYENTFDTSPTAGISAQSSGLSDTLALGTTSTQSFEIENLGRSAVDDLNYTISVPSSQSIISLSNTSGTLNSGEAQSIEATFSAESNPPNETYTVLLEITTNDPDQELVEVTASLTITPPPVTLSPPDPPPSTGTATAVDVTFPSTFTPSDGTLHYRAAGARTFNTTSLSFSGLTDGVEQTTSISVPKEAVSDRGVQYFLTLEGPLPSGSGTATLAVPDTASTYPAFFPAQADQVVAQGPFQAESYRMLSVPAALSDRSVFDVLKQQYGPYDIRNWRLARWDPQASSYQSGPSVGPLSPGEAVWLTTATGDSPTVSDARSPDAAAPQPISLQPGWNQIGNPFGFPVAWSSIEQQSAVRPPVTYDASRPPGERYRFDASTLRPWHGAFVYNPTDTSVTIQVPPVRAPRSATKEARASSSAAASPSYHLTLRPLASRTGQRLSASPVQLGFAPRAKQGFGPHDRPQPPSIGPHVRLSATSAEGPALTRNLKPPSEEGTVWDLTLGLPNQELQSPQAVSLLLNENGNRPEGFQLYVLDQTQDRRLAVTGQSVKTTLSPTQSTRRLRVIVGTEAFAKRRNNNTPLRITETKLRANAPNPFDDVTTIYYQLAQKQTVTLRVYDLLGRRVTTLVNRPQKQGVHHVEWRAEGAGGQPLSSGVYFLRMQAGTYTDTQKITIIR
jgi:hypothetical protein